MRFPRNTKIFRGQLDAAPYAGVFFLLVLFLILNSRFIFVPGIDIQLPEAAHLPGADGPTIAVVVDRKGGYYFDNQIRDEAQLEQELRTAVRSANEPLTLVVQADELAEYRVLARLWQLARSAGIKHLLQATRPPVLPGPKPGAE